MVEFLKVQNYRFIFNKNKFMRCLIIDNYDSFTWNLADYVSQIYGETPQVVYNNQYSWAQLKNLAQWESVIISPGPGSVTNPDDFHVCREALQQNDIPVLGICLGMQGLAHIYGGQIVPAPTPWHGRTSLIHHDGSVLFESIPSRFNAIRYHSLTVSENFFPEQLAVTARSEDGLIMAVEHVDYPKWGVQFHPESILTEYGLQLIGNFKKQAAQFWQRKYSSVCLNAPLLHSREELAPLDSHQTIQHTPAKKRIILSRQIQTNHNAEALFLKLYADEAHCFWLDSQIAHAENARFSFMGCVNEKDCLVYSSVHKDFVHAFKNSAEQFLTTLSDRLENCSVHDNANQTLPFEFCGGYVGYMSYEAKALFGHATTHVNDIPDAIWLWVEQFIAIDRMSGATWLVAVVEESRQQTAQIWMEQTLEKINQSEQCERTLADSSIGSVRIHMDCSHEAYLQSIALCQQKIVAGESYEICLTNRFALDTQLDPLNLYLRLRQENAAPFGAFIRHGKVCVLSTSPESFLKVNAAGMVQTRPIKGTHSRAADPVLDQRYAAALAASEKDRAENLMIVDLMRNDLAKVAISGSVQVSKLMEIESYQTVHQMVSSVTATLQPSCTLVELLRAVFPGGSITGAPKIRTMEILDTLEPSARGVYCGTIGYLGFNRIADLNIAIRSLSYDGQTLRFGAGGAVTHLSNPQQEFDEMMLKANALLRPVWHYLHGTAGGFEAMLEDETLVLQKPVL